MTVTTLTAIPPVQKHPIAITPCPLPGHAGHILGYLFTISSKSNSGKSSHSHNSNSRSQTLSIS